LKSFFTDGKKKIFAAGTALLLLVACVFLVIKTGLNTLPFGFAADDNANLALQRGVRATCDSMETEELSADKAVDGDGETLSSRWSSENNWEDASHFIELEFPEEISVSFVVLKWERTNVTAYRLEGSLDGENWQVLEAFEKAPASRKQEIPLAEAVTVRFLRLSTSEVSKEEEDYSNLYQNVSLYEFEVYADKPAAYLVKAPELVTKENNDRYMEMPEAPEGYRITWLGADYEQVIGAEGEVYETIQEKEVEVGFWVEPEDSGRGAGKDADDGREISFTIRVPAADDSPVNAQELPEAPEGTAGGNEKPEVIPAIAEWAGGDGDFVPGADARIVVQEEELRQTAELFAAQYREIMGQEISVFSGTAEDVRPGDFSLAYTTKDGLGEEGYFCEITDKCVITGTHRQGIYWGTVTALQILKGQEGKLPQGRIRDYPKYPVRGFGIDVARRPVSMAMLYRIVENMSWYKMNDLNVHLNDNVILSTSGLTGSAEEAMTAYSAFRIDSSVTNEKGERLTSSDYAYTAEEFADFIAYAESCGVRVVPEIDTPAHSLSLTKLFPEYALTVRNEALDQIDLSRREAVELVKMIWQEALGDTSGKAAFQGASVVNIGMDEYYGDGETYRQYMNEMIDFIREESGVETIRLWGSLSNIGGTTMPETEGLQMNIWSTVWADPLFMYRAGYTLINMQNNHLYIIPGGGYDYLDAEELYRNWEPNRFYDYNQLETIPAWSPQMAGAAYMIWNDMTGRLDVGISETELFDRFFAPLGVIGGKLWGETEGSFGEWTRRFAALGVAPGSNPYAEAVWEEDVLRIRPEETITLSGRRDYVGTGYYGGNGNGIGIGGNYTVRMEVYKEPSAGAEEPDNGNGTDGERTEKNRTFSEEILFETDCAYGQTAFKAVQKETGQVGFSREGKDFSFDYTLPEGEWVNLMIRGEKDRTSLYVNGKLVDTLGNGEAFGEYAAFVFPLERIGSMTDSFCGMIKEIEVEADGSIY